MASCVLYRCLVSIAFLVQLAGCVAEPRWLLGVENEQQPWAIHGLIVTDMGSRPGWVVFHRGAIVCVTDREDQITSNARRILYDGYIYPGLIDTHNHPHYNAIPKWSPGRTFENRYRWIDDEEYRQKVQSAYASLREAGLSYASLKYGELRAITGGTTSIQGSYVPPESQILIRNIDAPYQAAAFTPDINRLRDDEQKRLIDGLDSGQLRRCFFHLAEGVDPRSAQEFEVLRDRGFVRPGVVLIHGIALTRPQFRKVAEAGMYLVWSPSSNLTLYGKTADIAAALEEGVTVALAPDWSVTGSDNLLEELKIAWTFSLDKLGGEVSPRDLFKMVTTSAAEVAGVDAFLGRIAPRYAADLFLAPRLDDNPYVSLLKTYPRHIHLVFVDGVPVYGDVDALVQLVPEGTADTIQVDGVSKAVVMVGDLRTTPRAHERFEDVVRILEQNLPKLAPIIED